ncbi:hypothetical protein [Brevibacillus sp. NL20B1]|uniref:hypothetical protein n=1 Tax=Brevibacillus sp. NL20B1 TaxID=2829799 RepID=UPI001B93BB16|nr:hypothetical protein [Brevibacillus sp. NL20B1]MBR8661184.1 hypothetical protein [Brevibacillus sp. NL20B1]
MSETKRDLHSDLAICNAATPGPWAAEKGYEQSERGNYVYSQAEGSVVCAEQDGTDCVLTDADARFIAEARTGWPHAIERALAAEKEVARLTGLVGSLRVNDRDKTRKIAEVEADVERLRLIFGHPLVYEALAHYTDEHIDSDTHPDDWETVFGARVEAFKLAKEATTDDH